MLFKVHLGKLLFTVLHHCIYSQGCYMYITTVHQYCTADYTGAQMIIIKTIWNANTPISLASKNFYHFAVTIKNIFIFFFFC